MSATKVASICVGEAIRIYEGDQRVLPPASLSTALSTSFTAIGQLRSRTISAAVSAAASPAAPWPTTIKFRNGCPMSWRSSLGGTRVPRRLSSCAQCPWRMLCRQYTHDVLVHTAMSLFSHRWAESRLVSDARGSMKHQHTVADFHGFVNLVCNEYSGLVALPYQTYEFCT